MKKRLLLLLLRAHFRPLRRSPFRNQVHDFRRIDSFRAAGMRSIAACVRRGFIRRTDGRVNGPLAGKLVFAEKLFPVLKEADQHNHCRPNHPEKEHRFQQPDCNDGHNHVSILSQPECFTLAPVCNLPSSRGPPRDFPRACSSCPFPSPDPCLRGAPSLRGLLWCPFFGLSSRPRIYSAHILSAALFSSPTFAASSGMWATATGFATP